METKQILLILALLILFGVSGYLIYQNSQLKFQIDSSEQFRDKFLSMTEAVCGNITMVWNNRIRVDPFHSFREDECVGFRCLSMEGSNIETTPSCYNLKECNNACNGYCLHIESTNSICSFLSFIIKNIK